jgi:N-methylhydantoinase B
MIHQRGVLLEVMRNRFQAIVDEMASAILRAAHTVFVKETGDFGAALVSLQGEVFAAPVNIGVTILVGLPFLESMRRSRALGEEEGDVFIANDPFATRGMATHLPDLYVWKPMFHEGRSVCYIVSFIHASDIGGRVPGSIAPSNHEIYQEGLRIPPTKLLKRGEVNHELLDILALNVRIPEQNWGDLKALLAGVHTAERRVHELIDRYGFEAVTGSIGSVLDYAEVEARAIFGCVPSGTYTFWDYLEGDHVGGGVVRIKLNLHVDGSDLHLDFSETDPQVRFAINLPTFAHRGNWMIAYGVVNWLRSVAPGITYNGGLVRPIQLTVPEGNLLNPDEGAAVGGRVATILRVADTIAGALAQGLPEVFPAAGSGQSSILLVSIPDPQTGKPRVSVVQPLCGGSGGRPTKDGIDGIDVLGGFLRNIPTEVIEAEMPGLLVQHYGLRPDSGGPGYWRGGTGIELELRIFPPYAVVTSRAMERYRFRPWGRMGGRPGTTGRTLLNPRTAREQDLGKLDVLHLEPGDILWFATQGGGGYGDPLEREPELVLEDVRNGFVSDAAAREGYGVVIGESAVDVAGTAQLRAKLRSERSSAALFDFGPERLAFERRWPDEMQSSLNRLVAAYPTPLRTFLRERVVTLMDAHLDAGGAPGPEALDEFARRILEALGARPTEA